MKEEEMNIEEEIAILEFNLNIKYQEINCRDFFKVEYFFDEDKYVLGLCFPIKFLEENKK